MSKIPISVIESIRSVKKSRKIETMNVCKFNPNEYGYIQSIDMAKPYRQRRCPTCGLWTVFVHRKTKYTFSLCEGRESVMVRLGLARKALERLNCLTVPKVKRAQTGNTIPKGYEIKEQR